MNISWINENRYQGPLQLAVHIAKTVITKLPLLTNEKNLIDLQVISETPIYLTVWSEPFLPLKSMNGYPQSNLYFLISVL